MCLSADYRQVGRTARQIVENEGGALVIYKNDFVEMLSEHPSLRNVPPRCFVSGTMTSAIRKGGLQSVSHDPSEPTSTLRLIHLKEIDESEARAIVAAQEVLV